MKIGFDNNKYIKIQSKKIRERIKMFDKLYLEVGGKLFDDSHAARILPGFKNDVKISMFKELKDDLEIIFCINANDIEKNKTRSEYARTYDNELLTLVSKSKSMGFTVNSVVITLYKNQPSVDKFIKKLNRNGIKTYIHTFTKGYPTDVDTIVSEEGYGANPYVETTKPLVIVNAPGPGSGKLATCLSQIYHENLRGVNAGYAKFETFPVWNLPLKHPVNMAYEAATADLEDVNMIDPFHLEKYGKTAVNYNRDIEMFPVLKQILSKVSDKTLYYSPTDMGVNMVGFCITDNKIVEEASKKEIVRRYYNELNIDVDYLDVIKPALAKKEEKGCNVIAIKVGKKIITGRQTEVLTPASSAILNAIKYLSKIPDDIDLLSPKVLKPIMSLNENLGEKNKLLTLPEVLTALEICSVTNPMIEKALSCLSKLKDTDAHSTYIVENGDRKVFKELKINLTCENEFLSDIEIIE